MKVKRENAHPGRSLENCVQDKASNISAQQWKQTDSWTKTFRLYRSTRIKWINFFFSWGKHFFWYLICTRLHFAMQPGLLSREQEALRQLALTSSHYADVVLGFFLLLLLLPRSIWVRNRQVWTASLKNGKTNILSKLHLQPKRGWVRNKPGIRSQES